MRLAVICVRGIPLEAIPKTLRPALIGYLGRFITEHKKARIEAVLPWRTRYVTLVLEDIYQPQNASATLRTAEILGLQDVYVVENWNAYRLNPKVVLGASKWIFLYRFRKPDGQNTPRCMAYLRERGYRIVATSPHRVTWDAPEEVPLDRPVAFWFGSELEGLSETALQAADGILRIPMYGFTESYNISVSVGITLYTVIRRLHTSPVPWRLSEDEQELVRLAWYMRVLDHSDALVRTFLKEHGAWPLPKRSDDDAMFDDAGQEALKAFEERPF